MLTDDDLLVAEAAARSYPAEVPIGWTSTEKMLFGSDIPEALADGTVSFNDC